MATKRVRLTCYCGQKGAEGNPGDVVECDAATADFLLGSNAAKPVDDAVDPPADPPVDESKAPKGKK